MAGLCKHFSREPIPFCNIECASELKAIEGEQQQNKKKTSLYLLN